MSQNTIGQQLIRAAELRIGAPFAHSARAASGCPSSECAQMGTGPTYNCSGLVVASLCDVLGIAHHRYPHSIRHLAGQASHGVEADPEPGDEIIYITKDEFGAGYTPKHAALAAGRGAIVHADVHGVRLEPEIVARRIVVPAEVLAGVVLGETPLLKEAA